MSDIIMNEVWDVKKINICTDRRREEWIKIYVFPESFDIHLGVNGCKGHLEVIDLDAACRLRDFLVYALGCRQAGDASLESNEEMVK